MKLMLNVLASPNSNTGEIADPLLRVGSSIRSYNRAYRLRGVRVRARRTAGVLWRRTLPAMATTLAVYGRGSVPFFNSYDHISNSGQADPVTQERGEHRIERTPTV